MQTALTLQSMWLNDADNSNYLVFDGCMREVDSVLSVWYLFVFERGVWWEELEDAVEDAAETVLQSFSFCETRDWVTVDDRFASEMSGRCGISKDTADQME